MEVSGQVHVPADLPQVNIPWYPLDMRLGGTQSRSGRGGEEKNSQPDKKDVMLELIWAQKKHHQWRLVQKTLRK